MSASLPDEAALPAPYLLWPTAPLADPPLIALPAGYEFRSYRAGDERAFYPLLEQEGWPMTDVYSVDHRFGWVGKKM